MIFAYVAGQLVAHFSAFLLEQLVVARTLGRPTEILLGRPPRWKILRLIFPNYFRPLPENTQNRVKKQAEIQSGPISGEGLFLQAYAIVTSSPVVQARLDEFRNQYGFARNMSFAFLTSGMAILLAHQLGSHSVRLRWALISFLVGIGLFYRYLKFFRQYSYELFVRYAEFVR